MFITSLSAGAFLSPLSLLRHNLCGHKIYSLLSVGSFSTRLPTPNTDFSMPTTPPSTLSLQGAMESPYPAMPNDTETRPLIAFHYFPDLPLEIRLDIFRLSFPPPRTLHLQPTNVKSLPKTNDPSIIKRLYEEYYPVTLHVNRESRRETLNFYKLAIQDITQFDQQSRVKEFYGAEREITTWWCFNPAKDVFQLENYNGFYWLPHNLLLNPGLLETIKHVQFEVLPHVLVINDLRTSKRQFSHFANDIFATGGQYRIAHVGRTKYDYFLRFRNLEMVTLFFQPTPDREDCFVPTDSTDLYRHPLWLTAVSFYMFFAALAKLDQPRTTPKIIIKIGNATIPFEVDPNPESLKRLPHDVYNKSDFSMTNAIEDMVEVYLNDFTKTEEDYRDSGWEVKPLTWKDPGMGVVDELEWNSRYVLRGERLRMARRQVYIPSIDITNLFEWV